MYSNFLTSALVATILFLAACKEEAVDSNAVQQVVNKPQKETCSNCNQTDSNGKKQGLWIEKHSDISHSEVNYLNGVHSGVYKEFNSKGELLVLGEYSKGEMSGTWYYYKGNRITMVLENHTKNYETILREWDNRRYVPDYKAYCKTYHSNEKIKGEGWLLWNKNEDPNSYLSVEYGTWKYYNNKGELINLKDYNY